MDSMLAPSNEDIVAAVEEYGSLTQAAKSFGYTITWIKNRLRKDPELAAQVKAIREKFSYHGGERQSEQPLVSFKQESDGLVLTASTDKAALGDIGQLIRECGMDPDEWVVVSCTLNRWQGMTSDKATGDNRVVPLNQWKVTLKRAPHLVLAAPATHVPPVKRKRRVTPLEIPELIVVEGDHQVPYHCEELHQASLWALEEFHNRHNLVEHVFLGDTGDYPTISAHRDHPSAMATVNDCLQGVYELLRAKREAAPNARCRMLDGNHDWRLESELLLRAERMYGVRPASVDGQEELAALDLRRLLHLDALRVERVQDARGWKHAEVELVEGIGGLVVRHGWLTSANSAAKSLAKRGRSIIVGHTHRPEHHFVWDPSAGIERQAVTAGAMCNRGPHFVALDAWLQGFVTVTRWRDGTFQIEHARWHGTELRWRDRSWKP